MLGPTQTRPPCAGFQLLPRGWVSVFSKREITRKCAKDAGRIGQWRSCSDRCGNISKSMSKSRLTIPTGTVKLDLAYIFEPRSGKKMCIRSTSGTIFGPFGPIYHLCIPVFEMLFLFGNIRSVGHAQQTVSKKEWLFLSPVYNELFHFRFVVNACCNLPKLFWHPALTCKHDSSFYVRAWGLLQW